MLQLNFLFILMCFLYHESDLIIQKNQYYKQIEINFHQKESPRNTLEQQKNDLIKANTKNDFILSHSILPISNENTNITVKKNRNKRGVVQLYNMVSCATGCKPLSYKGYGCFCGFLGSGYPVDGIDRCCELHDWCYVAANCPMYLEYVVPYYWKCWDKKPFCATNHNRLGPLNQCATNLCECDRLLSECLSQFPCPTERALCTGSPFRLLQNKLIFF